MEFLSDKLHSATGNALSGVNKLKRARQKQQTDTTTTTSDINARDETQTTKQTSTSANTNLNYSTPRPLTTTTSQPLNYRTPGVPFGGDSSYGGPSPPPIGWRLGPLPDPHGQPPEANKDWSRQQPPVGGGNGRLGAGASEESLYQTDTWSRLWFQRVMILTVVRLLLFIRKVYEDYQATKTYNLAGHTGHFLVSATTLFLPTIVFTIYRVCRYLQVALPDIRPAQAAIAAPYPSDGHVRRDGRASKATSVGRGGADEAEDAQLTRALMGNSGSPTTTPVGAQQSPDDDGLVTARQTPTNLEEFHDSKSQQDQTLTSVSFGEGDGGTSSPAPSTAIVKDSPPQSGKDGRATGARGEPHFKETLDIDRLGDLPDKETTRVAIGASEQLLHGVMFIFWQLKRQVDVVGYLVERSCLWRKPRQQELEELERLRTGSDGLEWFQDFYAAFLAILAQVYTLDLHWSANEKAPQKNSGALGSAVSGLSGLASSGESGGDLAISTAARTVSETLRQHALAGNAVDGKDLLILSELLVSSAVIFSLLIAVRRRDDGPLTLGLSMLGWGSIFAARIIIIALSFVHIGWKIMLPLVFCHILGIAAWIYKIAIDSHNGKKDESEESKWDHASSGGQDEDEEAGETKRQSIELGSGSAAVDQDVAVTTRVTDSWSYMEHFVLISQIVTLFALPSLFYWPIMFNLKLHYRPFKYLVLILTENFILIPVIWLSISSAATPGQLYLLGMVGGLSIVGFIFISLYIACKPSLTEYFARADELFNEAERSGIYFEFCSRVFKMPDLSKHAFKRLMNQSEVVEQIEEDEEISLDKP